MTKHQKGTMGLGLDDLVLLLRTGLPDFKGLARCAEPDVYPDLFFDETPAVIAAAKSLCAECPMIDECLNYALTVDQYGVWGGTSAKERKQLRRNLDAPASVDVRQVENRRLLRSSQPGSVLARHFNVSERTIQRWRKELEKASGSESAEVA